MKDQYSDRIAALTAEAQMVRGDRTIARETKERRLGDLQAEIVRLTETRRVQHAQRGMSPVERRLREW